MYLTQEKKDEIFSQFGKDKNDTGSAEGQIALFTHRINHLTGHLKTVSRKDGKSSASKFHIIPGQSLTK